jgi:molybdopterin-guanine dinucleotide biosynthesis protein
MTISPTEIAILKKTDAVFNDLDQIIELFNREALDIIFIEGFHRLIAKRTDVPKIITADNEENLIRTLEGTAEPILAVTGVISENKPTINGLKIPILNLDTEGELLLQLVKKYVKNKQIKK